MDKRTIFIVDDDEDLLVIYEAGLKTLYTIQTFKSPDLLFQKIQSNQIPDILISDLHMPQRNGVEILKYIRSQNLVLPVILMSGLTEKSLLAEALKYPPVHFIEKPFTGQFLRNETRNAMMGVLLQENLGDLKNIQEEFNKLNTKPQ